MNLVLAIICILLSIKSTALERIDKKGLNSMEAHKVFVAYGRSSIIVLPCNVVSFSDGPTRDIQAQVNDRDAKMLEVWFAKNSPEPQELKVMCAEQRFVFDIIPNMQNHQSIFEVSRAYKSAKHHFKTVDQHEITKPKIVRVLKSSN